MGYLLCQAAACAAREGIQKRGFPPFLAGSAEVCREGREVQAYLTSSGLWGASAITQPEAALASAPAASHTLSTLGWLSSQSLGCLFCIEAPATETAAQPITVTAAESSRQGGWLWCTAR